MTLMESLPPIGWDKLATKEDLATLAERLNARTDRGLARQTYVMLVGMAALITPIYIALFTGAAG